ncbi:hypothetical protein M5K25_028039 [Dendrobium thyrsiflorum]|uniref:Uncharacterized protein n=1 Tax=Dendrobium thyrsiflorum TaxID=117978 RepID=A0ABD0TVH8_DENTH
MDIVRLLCRNFCKDILLSCSPEGHTLLSKSSRLLLVAVPSCMADPEHDHSYVFNDQGQVNILKSSFFNINLEINRTVEDYVDRIVFSLSAAIDEQLSPIQWKIFFKLCVPHSCKTKNYPISRHDVAIENEDEEGDEEDYEEGDNADEDNEAFLTFADDDSQEE